MIPGQPGAPPGGIVERITELRRNLAAHNVLVASAGVAFYGLLALVPTLIALVSIYGLLADPSQIERQVSDIAGSLDDTTRQFLTSQLEQIVGKADGSTSPNTVGQWVGLILGVGLALWSSSGAVQKLMVTVAVAYETEETRPRLKLRAMAYGFTAAALVGVSLMVFVIGVVPNLLRRVDLGGAAERTIAIFQYPVLALLFAVALTVLYRYAPDREPRTPWRNPGAVAGTLLFLAFAIGFSIYSANVGAMPASYGLLGSIAALMIFLQLTAISVIVGAEVNSMVESFPARDEALTHSRARSRDGIPRDRVPRDGMPRDRVSGDRVSGEGIGFGKAMAGLAALFLLGRSNRD